MRTGDYLAMHAGGHIGAVGALAFTPDGNGLFSGSWDSTVTHWDVSSLNSTYDGQKEDISTQDLTTGSGLRAISHFLGHRVRRVVDYSVNSSSHMPSIRKVYMPFLYLPMVVGLRLAH